MNVDVVIDIARETLLVIIKTSAPMLLVSLIVGLVISIFQTITSIISYIFSNNVNRFLDIQNHC